MGLIEKLKLKFNKSVVSEEISQEEINKQKMETAQMVFDEIMIDIKSISEEEEYLASKDLDTSVLDKKREKLTTKVLENIESCPEVMYCQNEDGENLGIIAIHNHYQDVADRILDDEKASLQIDNLGFNMGIWLAFLREEKLMEKAMQNEKLLKFKVPYISENYENKYYCGLTMTILAAMDGLDDLVSKAVLDKEVRLQQDSYGKSVGMHAIETNMKKTLEVIIQDQDAIIQQDSCGRNMGMYAIECGLEDVALKIAKNPIAIKQEQHTDRYGYQTFKNMYALAKQKNMKSVVETIEKVQSEMSEQESKPDTVFQPLEDLDSIVSAC